MKVIVIGSGMSGLTSAAYLARAGHEVTVLEQYSIPGGVTATHFHEGYGWDLGPLLLEGFGPGDRGTAVLEDLGVSNQVKTMREDRGLVFPDFSMWKPEHYEGVYWRRERLKQIFPQESANLDRYYRFYDRVLDLMGLLRKLEAAGDMPALILKLRLALAFNAVKDKVKWNSQQLMDSYFTTPEIKAFFLGIVADFVTKPSEFPALGVPSIHLETAFDKRIPHEPGTKSARSGYFYISGGCQSLVNAVMSVIDKFGGRVVTNASVEKIVVDGGRVSGVNVAGRGFMPADLVVASGGVRETFFSLVGRENLPVDFCQSIEDLTLMESVLMVHLGVDLDPTPYQPAALCYYYGTYDLETSVERCRAGEYHEGAEGFVIYVPSMHSPVLAPAGHHAVTIYTVAPDRLKEGSWEERREELADKLIAYAERYMPGLREHTRTRQVFTPADFRARLRQQHHSFGGLPPIAGKKNPPYQTPLENLWFVGAQSESGGGVVNVMVGARNAVRRMLS